MPAFVQPPNKARSPSTKQSFLPTFTTSAFENLIIERSYLRFDPELLLWIVTQYGRDVRGMEA